MGAISIPRFAHYRTFWASFGEGSWLTQTSHHSFKVGRFVLLGEIVNCGLDFVALVIFCARRIALELTQIRLASRTSRALGRQNLKTMHHIVSDLWLGSQQDADELIQSNPEDITAILNVRGPDAYRPPGRDQSGEHPGKAYKWIPAPDIGIVAPEHIKEGLLWLEEQTNNHQRILIHCMHGISRSPAFLAAFMVKSGISSSLEAAKAIISTYRPVHPAAQMLPAVKNVVLVSSLTGLPNRTAFDEARPSRFVAIVDVDLMKVFNDSYGRIAGDMLLRRLAEILVSVGLETYHSEGDEFLCRGDSIEELRAKLARARKLLGEPFQVYADGRIRSIQGMDLSFGIGASPEECAAALLQAKKVKAGDEMPEWRREIIAASGPGQPW
jgi:GGDEF domain-containing protein